ncbi:MAG: putative aminotransferase [Frankiales bacterium]|nr:putative aminotransferase [Frankiales bacterium]
MPPTIDVARVRADTPATASLVHLNNAGASLPPAPVLEAQLEYLRREAADGGYETADAYGEAFSHTYDAIGALIGARSDEIAVMQSASSAWNAALTSLRLGHGDRILTSRSEYVSNVVGLLQAAQRAGVIVDVVPDDPDGQLDVAALHDMLDERVRLIAVTHVPTSRGLVNPVADVGKVAAGAAVPFLLDGAQSIGQLDIDVDAIGCDFFAATARKFLRGPRGAGFLYVRGSMLERLDATVAETSAASLTGDRQFVADAGARRFESFERSYAAQVGLTAAVDYALRQGMVAIEERVVSLGVHLRALLADVTGVRVHDQGVRQCGIVTFSVAGREAVDICRLLRAQRINTSVSGLKQARWDFGPRGITSVVRASVHYYNDESDLDRLSTAIRKLSRPS